MWTIFWYYKWDSSSNKLHTNIIIFYLNIGGGVHTGSTRHGGHYWPIVHAPNDCEDGEVGGMNGFGRGNLLEKTCPDATLSTTNPSCQIRTRTRPAVVESQRLTASAMARPITYECPLHIYVRLSHRISLSESNEVHIRVTQWGGWEGGQLIVL
jgi:hypothetical protein